MDLCLNDFVDFDAAPYYPLPTQAMMVQETAAPYFPGNDISSSRSVHKFQGKLVPHWEASLVTYHLCYRLADSVPVVQLQEWMSERRRLKNIVLQEQRELTVDELLYLNKLFSEKIEHYLSSGYGECVLKDDEAAIIVKSTLEHDNEQLYLLHAWCIMPNHVHVIFHILDEETSLSDIIQAWKSVSSHRINRLLHRKGDLWQADCYNHIIRTHEEYVNQLDYVWNNPGNNVIYDENRRWRYDR